LLSGQQAEAWIKVGLRNSSDLDASYGTLLPV
jgi:hypothetical protein